MSSDNPVSPYPPADASMPSYVPADPTVPAAPVMPPAPVAPPVDPYAPAPVAPMPTDPYAAAPVAPAPYAAPVAPMPTNPYAAAPMPTDPYAAAPVGMPPAMPASTSAFPGAMNYGYDPYSSVGPTMSQPWNGLAVGGLVVGILSLVFFEVPVLGIILGIVAVIISYLALQRANQGSAGKGMAMAGLICGGVGVVVGLIWTIWIFAIAGS